MNFKFTKQGKRLQATLQAGQKLILTKAEGGDAYLASPEELLSVQGKKQILQIEQAVIEDSTAIIKLTLTNLEIQTGYRLRQIGIYAKTDSAEEVLYIVGQDEQGEEVPAITEKEVEYDYSLQISFDNAYEISYTISGNDFAKKTYVKELLQKKVDVELNKHASNQSNPHNVTKEQLGLGNVDNTHDSEKRVKSAEKWTTPRQISLAGNLNGNATFDGSQNVVISADVVEAALIPLTLNTWEDQSIVSVPDLLNRYLSAGRRNVIECIQGIRRGLRFALHGGHIADNCVTDNAGMVLSARQGKVLMDRVNETNAHSTASGWVAINNAFCRNGAAAGGNPGQQLLRLGHLCIFQIDVVIPQNGGGHFLAVEGLPPKMFGVDEYAPLRSWQGQMILARVDYLGRFFVLDAPAGEYVGRIIYISREPSKNEGGDYR